MLHRQGTLRKWPKASPKILAYLEDEQEEIDELHRTLQQQSIAVYTTIPLALLLRVRLGTPTILLRLRQTAQLLRTARPYRDELSAGWASYVLGRVGCE